MYIISKIVGFILDPILWIVALIVFAFLTRRQALKPRLYRWAALLLLVFTNPWLVNNLWYAYQAKAVDLRDGEQYSTAILLGGLAGLDEFRNKGIFTQSSDRFIQTARLYETGRVKKILVTGGDSRIIRRSVYNEADFLASNLQDLKIPVADILVENDARNTIENARFSKRILDSTGIPGPYLLVTSAIHMPRALKIYRAAGMDVKPYPCNFVVVRSNTKIDFDNFVPSGSSLYSWKILLKEWVGQLQLTISN